MLKTKKNIFTAMVSRNNYGVYLKNFGLKCKNFANKKFIAVFFVSLSMGIPISLLASTLIVWLTESGVSKATLGITATLWLPYVFKFLWAPIIDIVHLPILSKLIGQKRSWLLCSSLLVILSLMKLAHTDPVNELSTTFFFAFCTSFASATHEIVSHSYRINLLSYQEQAKGTVATSVGHRIGMTVSGAGALFLSNFYSWSLVYSVLAPMAALGWIAAMFVGEPVRLKQDTQFLEKNIAKCTTYTEKISVFLNAVILKPFGELFNISGWFSILTFLLFFKIGYEFFNVMYMPFLLEIGYTKTQIATIDKVIGSYVCIFGAILAPLFGQRIGMFKTLFVALLMQSIANLLFTIQCYSATTLWVLVPIVLTEKFCIGFMNGTFITYASILCADKKYTGTLYALFLSISLAGKTIFATPSGLFAEVFGWLPFFIFSAILPSISMCILWIRRSVFIK